MHLIIHDTIYLFWKNAVKEGLICWQPRNLIIFFILEKCKPKNNVSSSYNTGYLTDEFPQSIAHVPVPQTIDKGVKHLSDHRIHHWSHWGSLKWLCNCRADIHPKTSSIEQGNNWQMRPTSGKGFILSTRWWHSQDRGHDVNIRKNDSRKWSHTKQAKQHINDKIIEKVTERASLMTWKSL